MTAYYWTQLYTSPHEMSPEKIVRNTVQGLIDAGCTYQYVDRSYHKEGSLSRGDQVRLTRIESMPVEKAIALAVQDITIDETEGKGQFRRVPESRLVFRFDFAFDPEILTQFDPETSRKVRDVRVDFWRRFNPNVGPYINISMDVWEEYVLLYGKPETHQKNLHSIVDIAASVAEQIAPFYGWMDVESNSFDVSLGDFLDGKWPNGNQFILIGPQYQRRIAAFPKEQAATRFRILSNGTVIFKHRE